MHTTVGPLINPTHKLILSNVSPSILHEYTEKFLISSITNINIRMTSKLTFLRLDIQETGFIHAMSFRKQVFINPDDLPNIPYFFLIISNHDNRQYRIVASTDKFNCFLCKQEGHADKDCINASQFTVTNQGKQCNLKTNCHKTNEYTNRANNTNVSPNTSNITGIDATNNRRRILSETDDLIQTFQL